MSTTISNLVKYEFHSENYVFWENTIMLMKFRIVNDRKLEFKNYMTMDVGNIN